MTATALLSLLPPPNATRVTLALITLIAPLATVGNDDLLAGVLIPSPLRKIGKTSHQKQLQNQNDKKKQSIHNQVHAHATTLVVVEREKEEKENRHTTNMVIAQVEGEFKARGFEVHLTKATINRHVANGMIGTKPPPRGIVGSMPVHAFDLLVLAVESFIQINQVNCIVLEWQGIICAINKCCGIVVVADGGLKLSLFLRVMRATNVSLNVTIAWPIK